MSATSSASLSAASASTTPGACSTPGKDPKKRVDPADVSRTFLACGLCSDLYVDPKLLPCFHSFCKRCLLAYIPDHSLSLACPSCRQHSILPVAGVSALRDNHFLLRLLQQMDGLGQRRLKNGHKNGSNHSDCAITDENVLSSTPANGADEDNELRDTPSLQDRSVFDSTADDLSIDIDNSSEVFDDQPIKTDDTLASMDISIEFPAVIAKCLQHESSDLNHFCVECDTVICKECLEAEHRKHSVRSLEEFSSTEKCSLEKLLNNVRESSKSIDTSLRNIVKTKLKLERQKLDAEDCVERSFASIREVLDRKREALLAEIETGNTAKSKKLEDQRKEVSRLKKTIETCCSFVESCLDEKASQVCVILARKELSEKLEQFCKSNVQLLPEENPFISFNQGKLSVLSNIVEESLKQSNNPSPTQETSPMGVKTSKTKTNQEIRKSGKPERPQKARKPLFSKTSKMSSKAGDSADSEASSESSDGTCTSVGPQDFGSIVNNSAVPQESTASGEHLRRCFLNIPSLITVTSKNAKGANVGRGGAKLSAKIYTLEVGYKSKSESNKSELQVNSDTNMLASSLDTTEEDKIEINSQNDQTESIKDHKVSFHQNSLTESSVSGEGTTPCKREDIVTISKAEDIKARSIYKRTLLVPEVHDLGNGTYELTFMVTENSLKRYSPANQSTLDVSKATAGDSGRLTPQSPSRTPTHRDLHSSLDKLPHKKRPKSAPEVSDLLESVQLEIKLYGQQIKGSPFNLKVRKEVTKFPKDQKTSSSSYLNSRHSTEWNSRRHSGSATAKRALMNSKPFSSGANRKPSSASASQNDGPCQRIGVKGHNKGEFMNLQGIAVHDDRIYVADSNGQCVQAFSLDGKCLLKFGAKGRSPGQLQRPTGVTCTPDGLHILVSDYENKWVGVYTNEGRYVNRLGQGKLAGPKGVSIDKQGRVVIVDNRSSTVWLYTLSGKIIGKFGARGICASSGSSSPSASSPSGFITTTEAHAKLAGPHFCSIDPDDGDVVVTDFHNHRVKVFSSDGQYKFSFGSAGDGNGQFNAPTGICVDKQGNILVADWGNSRVQIFDKYGSFLSHIDTSADPLYGPQGLAISPDNTVIVADSGNHCLKVYKHLFA